MSVSDLIEIKARSKSGVTQTFNVLEILEINGRPYHSSDAYDELRSHVIHLDGRLTAIETIISKGT